MKIGNTRSASKYFLIYLLSSTVSIYLIFAAYEVYISIYVAPFDFLYFVSYIKANITFAYMCWKFHFLIFAVGIRFYLLNIMYE